MQQPEGADHDVRAGEIVKEKVGTGRWLAMYLGLFGTCRTNKAIDLQLQRNGEIELRSDLPVEQQDTRSASLERFSW